VLHSPKNRSTLASSPHTQIPPRGGSLLNVWKGFGLANCQLLAADCLQILLP